MLLEGGLERTDLRLEAGELFRAALLPGAAVVLELLVVGHLGLEGGPGLLGIGVECLALGKDGGDGGSVLPVHSQRAEQQRAEQHCGGVAPHRRPAGRRRGPEGARAVVHGAGQD